MRKERRKKLQKNDIKSLPAADKGLLVLTILLTVLGIIAIANASAPSAQDKFNDSFYFVKQQLMWGVVGAFVLVITSRIKYTFWQKVAPYFFGFSVLLLVAVLIPGLGLKIYGARRWLNLGFTGFQPSELVKLSLAVYIAYLTGTDKPLTHYLLAIGLVTGLVMIQPDMGTTLVIAAVAAVQVFIIGVDLSSALVITVPAIISAILMVILSDYRRERLFTFLQSSSDPLDSSYHIRQILLAVGSGGIFGVGLGQSRQKYLFLPEVATDSVFAIIAEEMGFIGASVVVLLLTYFILKIVKIALKAPDDFSKVLTVGIATWLAIQFFLNIGSMVALVPLTGIPLPFFSYGGTSLVMILFAVGILLNISRYTIDTKSKRK